MRNGSESGVLVEYRTCHGLQRFLRLQDGSLLPVSLDERVVDDRRYLMERRAGMGYCTAKSAWISRRDGDD